MGRRSRKEKISVYVEKGFFQMELSVLVNTKGLGREGGYKERKEVKREIEMERKRKGGKREEEMEGKRKGRTKK